MALGGVKATSGWDSELGFDHLILYIVRYIGPQLLPHDNNQFHTHILPTGHEPGCRIIHNSFVAHLISELKPLSLFYLFLPTQLTLTHLTLPTHPHLTWSSVFTCLIIYHGADIVHDHQGPGGGRTTIRGRKTGHHSSLTRPG